MDTKTTSNEMNETEARDAATGAILSGIKPELGELRDALEVLTDRAFGAGVKFARTQDDGLRERVEQVLRDSAGNEWVGHVPLSNALNPPRQPDLAEVREAAGKTIGAVLGALDWQQLQTVRDLETGLVLLGNADKWVLTGFYGVLREAVDAACTETFRRKEAGEYAKGGEHWTEQNG